MRIMIGYPGEAYSTYDVAHGYERALSDLGHDVQAFNYHNALSFYDAALSHYAEANPTFGKERAGRLQQDKLVLASERLIIEAVDFVPDVVLFVSGLQFHARAYYLLRKLGIPIVIAFTESPYLDGQQAVIAEGSYAVAVLVNDRASVEPMEQETGLPVAYLPHSFDPERHYPRRVPPDYFSDLFFFGTLWPERQRLFRLLLASQNGHNYHIAGIDPTSKPAEYKPMDNDEVARRYSGTHIALNHHRTIQGHDGEREIHVSAGEAYSLGPRAYEIAACGAFQLCDDTRAELREVFGDTVATYKDSADLRDKVTYYLDHKAERRAMAEAARQRVQGCSFEKRAESVLVPFLEGVL